MATIRHGISNGQETEITEAKARDLVRVCGHAGNAREWQDHCGGKLLQFVTVTLNHNCGKIYAGFASRACTRKFLHDITAG